MGATQSNVLYTNDTIVINKKTYTILKKSGEGTYGKVYAVQRNSDGMKFIVKIIVNDPYGKNELDIMKLLSYYPKCTPYIVCLHESEITIICIIMKKLQLPILLLIKTLTHLINGFAKLLRACLICINLV